MIPRLGVNVDHVATLRQARGEAYPSPREAAKVCFAHGADQLTIHLREDRRHIQDFDVEEIAKLLKKEGWPLNLEIGLADEIIDIAIKTSPDWLCIVPEKREERTTEGGLDLKNDDYFRKVKERCAFIKKQSPMTKISLFVEADDFVLKRSIECSIDAVEIHTGEYAKDFLNKNDLSSHLLSYAQGKVLCDEHNIGYHAGHGLTLESVQPLLQKKLFVEYNIGHAMIADSIFKGLGPVVSEMKNLFKGYSL